MNSNINIKWFGLTDYNQSLEIQSKLFQDTLNSNSEYLLGFEYHNTITLGKRGLEINDLKFRNEHEKEHFKIFHVNRGGQATLHSNGQLVIYPIINLNKHKIGVKDFVNSIEDITIEFLKCYNINSFKQKDLTGLFTDKGKIAYLGFRIEKDISTHGLSINVNNDTSLFKNIRSCGIESATFDRISSYINQETTPLKLEMVFLKWCEEFKKKFT